MKLFKIKHRFTGKVLFSFTTTTMKLCVEAALNSSIHLRYADLRYADLRYADLRDANLSGADKIVSIAG